LAGTAPAYLLSVRWPLPLAAVHCGLLTVEHAWSRSRNQFGDRCFTAAGPTLWNSSPEPLRHPDINFGQFKRLLKSFVWLAGAL